MGSRNRKRRAPRADAWSGPSADDAPAQIVTGAVDALVMGRGGAGVDLASARLADTEDAAWARAAEAAVAASLADGLASAWSRGWRPAETVRHVGRELGGAGAALCAEAVAAQMRRHSPGSVDPRWTAEVRALGASAAEGTPLAQAAAGHGLLRFEAADLALRLLSVLRVLPPLGTLGPVPGAFRPGPAAAVRPVSAVDRGKLERVRALLAKAESTEFPSEAEALSARAQELMARHSIDRALLDEERSPGRPSPAGARRLPVDAPYDEHKAVLLHEVAEANRCRAVWHQDLGLCTVVGFEGDLDAVELMYTSLLVQAESAMRVSGAARDRSGRGARRDFRASFVSAFAVRVGERLAEAARAAAEEAAAEAGASLVPVLADRERRVGEAVEEAFGELTHTRVRGPRSAEGWREGRAAADAASLGSRRPVADG
ncbi:DUF2786 domain-containing protein [Nocardiopsis sp. LOL_012]|uniref:DUF2786 domain-containing protein n=1 Tax=Nocardiopsis sp. LOL_012 TaxID=3345409 RepID=UPI003A86D577